ncbi:CRISPR/Cas system-associated exonuclease Cas4 (RecB family) [Brevibacillus aydinogluensis]|jgi:CRISPR/Cas system-associated exonuclease Cas4 (RecB family)|uniref:PD-(D/E)XK nuclease family protein n=1 Tax=Brevibacillus aydinogluensis TaxID=927786 RepID=UPI0028929BE1|nr:PD-(D/E)XK nuclease family protein [Brevibacillus aydinogluensis]MDT3417141.1 CRISPR/Cas system-associated exonuclease Cas4 (RecB family) [Brevibacillus aydinogluensis]
MIYSFSRLSLYEQCPFRFYLRYVLHRKEPMTAPLALGKATHKGIESIINKGCGLEEAIADGYVEVDFFPINRADLVWLVRSAPVHYGMGRTEQHFLLPLSDTPGAPQVQGYIDLDMDDSFVDWKTNRVPYKLRETMQIPLYAWAIMKTKGVQSIKGSLFFLRFKKWDTEVFDRSLAETGRRWAYELAMRIEQSLFLLEQQTDMAFTLFPAKPSKICRTCPFALECYQIQNREVLKHGTFY